MANWWQDEGLEELGVHVPCQWECPALVRVPTYIQALQECDPSRARDVNTQDVLLPGVLGRICTRPCENVCRHGRPGLGAPVAICDLKRAAADRAVDAPEPVHSPVSAPSGRTVAVVGGGPAGLATAWHLWRLGHRVTLIEAREECGGLPLLAIPAFRLPRDVVRREVRAVLADRFEVRTATRLGRDVTLDDLRARHDAVVLATGCHCAHRADVPGETLPGVLPGLDFLLDVNAGLLPPVGNRVVILGGGFTAVDCARIARRLGAAEVTLAYRRETTDARWSDDERRALAGEGVTVRERLSPLAIEGDDRVQAVRFARTRLEAGPGGHRVAHPIPGDEVAIPADQVIVALGQEPVPESSTNLDILDPACGRTSFPDVFLAGDRALGTRTVVDAIGHGARVARTVDAFLHGRTRIRHTLIERPAPFAVRTAEQDAVDRVPMPEHPIAVRLGHPDTEVESGLDDDAAATEARRCYLCDLVFRVDERRCVFCDKCIDGCPVRCITYTRDGRPEDARDGFWKRLVRTGRRGIVIAPDPCTRCGICADICPVSCIAVTRIDVVETIDP